MITDDHLNRISDVMEIKLQPVREEIAEARRDTSGKVEAVYKEVLEMRQDRESHQQQHDNVNQRLDDIEATPTVAHELKKN